MRDHGFDGRGVFVARLGGGGLQTSALAGVLRGEATREGRAHTMARVRTHVVTGATARLMWATPGGHPTQAGRLDGATRNADGTRHRTAGTRRSRTRADSGHAARGSHAVMRTRTDGCVQGTKRRSHDEDADAATQQLGTSRQEADTRNALLERPFFFCFFVFLFSFSLLCCALCFVNVRLHDV